MTELELWRKCPGNRVRYYLDIPLCNKIAAVLRNHGALGLHTEFQCSVPERWNSNGKYEHAASFVAQSRIWVCESHDVRRGEALDRATR